MGRDCLTGTEFYFGVVTVFWDWREMMAHNMVVRVLHATEMCTFQWFPLGHVIVTLIFQKKKPKKQKRSELRSSNSYQKPMALDQSAHTSQPGAHCPVPARPLTPRSSVLPGKRQRVRGRPEPPEGPLFCQPLHQRPHLLQLVAATAEGHL